MAVWQLWHTLDALYPMPISRTRDRICGWLYDAQQMGLITMSERADLLAADMDDRTATVEAYRKHKEQIRCL